jgi:membrane dipeptidase
MEEVMSYAISDIHCDLLCYLAGNSAHTANNPNSRCSIPQLHEGNVKLQTLAIFSEEGPNALSSGIKQFTIYKELPELYPDHFIHAQKAKSNSSLISLHYVFEGASTFCSPQEPLKEGLNRLEQCFDHSLPLYISLTWNGENRFGGGSGSNMGLKEDGESLLDFMDGRGVAIDLSHTSDPLAWDILHAIDKNNFKVPVIASHSNSRLIKNVPRNLPDELLVEIIRRGGVIGLNSYRHFVGDSIKDFCRHAQHIINLGGEECLVLGCDFFYDLDLPPSYRKEGDLFFSEMANASGYPYLMELFKRELNLNHDQIQKIANRNLEQFLAKLRSFS